MTPNDIARSSLLDLVFEGRNKNYGAYELRKHYDRRLILALSGMALLVAIILVVLNLGTVVSDGVRAFRKSDDVAISVIELQTPKPLPATVRPTVATATKAFVNRVLLVPDPVAADMPDQKSLHQHAIATHEHHGPLGISTAHTPAGAEDGSVLPAAQALAPAATPAPQGPTEAPSFPGGIGAWSKFLARHLVIPAEVQPGERLTVLVRFQVGEDGTLTGFNIVQSGGRSCDEEVLRVLRKMPRWKPALQQGVPVATSFTQPVTFEVHEQ